MGLQILAEAWYAVLISEHWLAGKRRYESTGGARYGVLKYDGKWDHVKRALVEEQIPAQLKDFEDANPTRFLPHLIASFDPAIG